MRRKGAEGEVLACDFLIKNGYEILARNWRGKGRLRSPEIDIIARDGKTIVFIEVKSFASPEFNQPEYRLDLRKLKRIAHAARAYLSQIDQDDDYSCRFDVMIVNLAAGDSAVDHIEDAFRAPDDLD